MLVQAMERIDLQNLQFINCFNTEIELISVQELCTFKCVHCTRRFFLYWRFKEERREAIFYFIVNQIALLNSSINLEGRVETFLIQFTN